MIHICGSFTNKEDACKFCENFNLWGVSTGHCTVFNGDVDCNDTCEYFKIEDERKGELYDTN